MDEAAYESQLPWNGYVAAGEFLPKTMADFPVTRVRLVDTPNISTKCSSPVTLGREAPESTKCMPAYPLL